MSEENTGLATPIPVTAEAPAAPDQAAFGEFVQMTAKATSSRMTQAKAQERYPIRVRVVETANGVTGEAQVAASFSDEASAEDFIRGELMKWKSFGFHDGHNWGRNSTDHHVRYWTEARQETASVKKDRLHDGGVAAG